MLQYKTPIIILVLLILVGSGSYFYKESRSPVLDNPSKQTGDLTSDFVNSLEENGLNAADEKPPVVKVSEATAEFVLNEYTGYGRTLNYSLQGPKLTLNSSKNATVAGVVEIYDDTNKLITAKNIDFISLQKGNQVLNVPSGVVLQKQGKYSVNFKLLTKSDDKEIFSKNFENMLVGITSYPLTKSVSLEVLDMEHTYVASYNYDSIRFSMKAKNVGNSDVLGYYKIQTFINGSESQKDLRYGISSVGRCTPYIWSSDFNNCGGNRIFIEPGKESVSNYAATEKNIVTLRNPHCKKGDSIEVKVSFMESIETGPTAEGKVLGVVSLPRQTCLSK